MSVGAALLLVIAGLVIWLALTFQAHVIIGIVVLAIGAVYLLYGFGPMGGPRGGRRGWY